MCLLGNRCRSELNRFPFGIPKPSVSCQYLPSLIGFELHRCRLLDDGDAALTAMEPLACSFWFRQGQAFVTCNPYSNQTKVGGGCSTPQRSNTQTGESSNVYSTRHRCKIKRANFEPEKLDFG